MPTASAAAKAAPAPAKSTLATSNAGIQLAQSGWYGPRYRGYRHGRRYRRGYGAPPPRRAYRPYGVVAPGTVRLRLIARGYYAIRGIRYVPHRPGRYRRGPGARFPGHYVAFARRLGVVYRFHLNPYTGRPYTRVRIY